MPANVILESPSTMSGLFPIPSVPVSRSSSALSAALTVAALVLGACGGEPADDARSPERAPGATASEATPAPTHSAASPSLAAATSLGVENAAMPRPGLLTAAQPTREQIDGLAAAGFRHFVSLRPPEEDGAGWEEAYLARHDLEFHRLPVAGAAGLTRENVEAFTELLSETGDEPTVVYCASSNRVGAMLALKAYWLDGASPEEALALGRAGGLAGLADRVTEIMQEP